MGEKTDIEREIGALPGDEDVKLGDISNETLSPEEDRRILRKIDRWYAMSSMKPDIGVCACH